MAFALGIDLGTGSLKTILINDCGEIIATASANYPLHQPRPNWVEQDTTDWWSALCDTTRRVIETAPISAHEIHCVALSGQLNGAVFVDTSGMPLRRPILWLDHRSQAECDWANDQADSLLRSHTMSMLNPINTLAKVLWVNKHEPDIYSKTHFVLLPKDWLRFQLTDTFATDVTDGSVTAAFDLRNRQWSTEILDKFEIRRDIFPAPAESPEIVGHVTAEASKATGLSEGTPVCAGGGDMPCMVLGSGVITPGIVSIGIGTAGHCTTFAESVSDAAFNQLWPMCHSMPGKYAWLGCTYTGGASLSWLRGIFGESYEAMAEYAAEAPPGAEGLFYLPWLEGAATPNPDTNAKGGFLGLTLRHTKAHLTRALMEGVAFDLRHSLEIIKILGLPINEIRIGEGGSRSPLWCQIQADVFAHDVRVIETEDLSAVGAALIAGVAGGLFPNFETACAATIKFGEMVAHNPERTAIYEQNYQRYCEIYPSLKKWFAENATGT